MGVLTDIVIADDIEAAAIATARVPSQEWPGIDAKGIDQVKLATLWALLAHEPFRAESVDEFTALHEASEDGPWVYRVPGPLVQLLANMDDTAAAMTSSAWAGTEEFALDGWEADAVRTVLDELRRLARDARTKNKSLLMWMSL